MNRKDELALKVTKEIAVKLIEVGRLSVNSFETVWKQIHKTVYSSINDADKDINN